LAAGLLAAAAAATYAAFRAAHTAAFHAAVVGYPVLMLLMLVACFCKIVLWC
jgi:hypothetical protein